MENLKEGYKKTEIGIIPEDWKVVKLGDIFEIKAGGDISKDRVSKERKDKYIYPIYANSVSKKGLYGYTDTFKIDKPCITVTARGNLGVAIARFEKFYPIVRLLILMPKKEVDLIFCEHQINRINILNESTGVPQLTSPQMATYKIPLPPLQEQKKIAQILSTWDNAIEKLELLINKKTEYKKGLMQKLLSGELRFPEFKEEWEEVRLGDIGEFKTSSVDKKSKCNEKPIKLVNYMDVYNNRFITKNMDLMETTAKDKQIETNNLLIGDVLFTPSSETPDDIGHSAVVIDNLENTLYSYHLVRFRLNIDMDLKFRGYVFNSQSVLNEFSRKATGSTRYTLSIKDFSETIVKIPTSLQEQQKIAEILTLQDKEIELLKKKLNLLKEQKKGLMQNLLTGKIRVKT